jgi:hypothetical protein
MSELDATERAHVARAWLTRARTEANAVIAFSAYADDLRALAAPDALLAIARAAVDEEAEHARLCLRLAEKYAQQPLVAPAPDYRPPVLVNVPDAMHPLLRILIGTALSETMSTSFLQLLYQRAEDADVRATVRQLLSDEIDHARLGWAVLALPAITPEMRGLLGGILPKLVALTLAQWRGGGATDLSAHGCPAHEEVVAHARATMEGLVLPGFAALGIDVGPAHQQLKQLVA